MAGLASLVAVPAIAAAKPPLTSFDQLPSRLRAGQKVTVIDTSGTPRAGEILSLSETALTLMDHGERHEFPAARVSAVKKHQRTSLAKGALIGFGAGVGAGGIALIVGGRHPDLSAADYLPGFLVFGETGAASGLGLAALMPGNDQTVFQAASGAGGLRVTVAPLLLPTRKSVAIRVSF